LAENHLVPWPDSLINLMAEQPKAQIPIGIYRWLDRCLLAMKDCLVTELGPVPNHTDAEPDDAAQEAAQENTFEESDAPQGAIKFFLLTPRQPSNAPD
jgi:hypothetical protein